MTPCQEFDGARDAKGYGKVHVSRKTYLAHRVAYALHHGEDPGPMHVLHKCDNPPCVNPEHLFLGTHTDNMRDMQSKGRANHYGGLLGEENKASKLTEEKVRLIREMHAAGDVTQSFIALLTGTSQTRVSDVINRKSWAHVK